MASSKKKTQNESSHQPNALKTISNQSAAAKADKICHVDHYFREHPFLASLIPKSGVLFECDGDAPSPSKDYGQLQVSLNKIVLRWWKITLRNVEGSMYPGEIKDSFEDFYYDEVAQREIWRIFGPATLNYCLNLVRGQFDWLVRLPESVQIRILSYVDLNDIPQLSLVCKSFRQLCRNNDLWRIFYAKHYGQHALENRELIHLAESRGWRHVFFTNRVKLRMELRRSAQLERHHPEDPSDLVQARQRRVHIQPSPPSTPRNERTIQPTIRRHSFATRKEPTALTPRFSPLLDRLDSPRSPRIQSPALSTRSNAGSTASAGSAQPPVQHPRSSASRR